MATTEHDATYAWPVTAQDAVERWHADQPMVHFIYADDVKRGDQIRDLVIWSIGLLLRDEQNVLVDRLAPGSFAVHDDTAFRAVTLAGAAMGFFPDENMVRSIGTLVGAVMADGWRETVRQFHPSLYGITSRTHGGR